MRKLITLTVITLSAPLILAGAFAMWVYVSRDVQPIVFMGEE